MIEKFLLHRGNIMRRIISFCLWGDAPLYNVGAIRNAELADVYFPEWDCRFYIGDDVPSKTIYELNSFDNTEIVMMNEYENDWQASIWRFFAIDLNADAEYVILRDTDCRLGEREKRAVDVWINSGKAMHIMRDHPLHTHPILAGMWGCHVPKFFEMFKNKKLPTDGTMKDVYSKWLAHSMQVTAGVKQPPNSGQRLHPREYNQKGIDQEFLRFLYGMLTADDVFVHDSFPHYNAFGGHHPTEKTAGQLPSVGFPIKFQKGPHEFVGQDWDENDVPTATSYQAIKNAYESIMSWDKK